jgi:lysophospholipase L1-like esterase
MPDGLHPSAKGYAIWADAIQSAIDQYVPKPAGK